MTKLSREEDGKLVMRGLNGKDKLAIFKGLSEKHEDFMESHLPDFQNIKKTQKLWTDFYHVLEYVKDDRKTHSYVFIRDRTRMWLDLFLEV